MPDAKLGLRLPDESTSPLNVASDDTLAAARVTAIVVLRVVAPSSAVTSTVMVVVPTFNAIASDALPRATTTPPTRTVAALLVLVGVTVIEATPFATAAV